MYLANTMPTMNNDIELNTPKTNGNDGQKITLQKRNEF